MKPLLSEYRITFTKSYAGYETYEIVVKAESSDEAIKIAEKDPWHFSPTTVGSYSTNHLSGFTTTKEVE